MAENPVNSTDAFVIVDVTVAGQSVFAFDFRADAVEDLKAIYTSPAAINTPYSGGVDFAASGLGNPLGGTITFTPPLAFQIGGKVTIYRNIVIERTTDYTQDLFSDDLNRETDTIFMVLQELARDIGRAIKNSFDSVVIAAGRVLVSDGVGGLVEGPSATDIASAQAYSVDAKNYRDQAEEFAAIIDPASYYTKSQVDTLQADKANKAVTINGAGLATGGGDISANRTINVPKATNAQALAGTDDTTAMTPLRTSEAIAAKSPPPFSGAYSVVSLAAGAVKQNTTGKALAVVIDVATTNAVNLSATLRVGASPIAGNNPRVAFNFYNNGQNNGGMAVNAIVAPGEYYSWASAGFTSSTLYEKN